MRILLLDQDGPLADFDQAFWDLCDSMGFEMDITCLTDPKRKRFMSDNILDPKHRKLARAYIESGHNRWFHDLPVTPGAEEGVEALLKRSDIDVWVCTKPLEVNDRCRDDKGLWMRRHFPELEHKMILAPNKGMVKGSILLDDAPKSEWFRYAEWEPVIFPSVFNEGGEWTGLRRWTWGDPIEELIYG
jgi:5'(3')-deoxyribonucleotidase